MTVAVVTGGARGIGAAIVDRLAGIHQVACFDLEPTAGWSQVCDVGRPEQVAAAIARVEAELGPVEVVVNNAGIGGPFHRVDEVSDDEWTRIIDTNLRSVFLMARAVLPGMKARGFGRVVNIASSLGLAGARLSSTYTATKHGVIGYTKAIAAEWGEHGITCNAVCPGYIDTSMAHQDEVDASKIVARTPAGRLGTSAEVADAVAWLVSDEARFVNGAVLTVDGGLVADLGVT